jgi:2-polyprenyl-3-methyl-5-hydroxy-6-metoxy-1,4-benzoquinol methylase
VRQSTSWVRTIRKTRWSFLNLFGRNEGARWDRSHADGQWTCLDSLQQCPRHYVIAGMVRVRGAQGASMLDVGCGTGALVPHLPLNVSRYVGIDISGEAIRGCREKHGHDRSRTFLTVPFEEYAPLDAFHVIVFNEMLYYYPVSRIPEVMSRARALLRCDAGTIIVSVHNRSLKRRQVWRQLHRCMSCTESTEAGSPSSGGSWRIKRYEVVGSHGC